MENVLPSLLLAMEFFIHVCEVNSSSMYYGIGTSRQYRPNKDENEIVLDYMGMDIYVTRKSFPGNVHVPCKCIFPEKEGYPIIHGIPEIHNKKKFNFTTVPLYSLLDGVRYCVAYIQEHGELLGVQAPPVDHIADPKRYKGDPRTLSPDKFKYYLTYLGWDFVVYHKEGNASSPTDVNLYPYNKPNSEYKSMQIINRFHVRVVKIKYADITFFAARRYKKNQRDNLVLNSDLVIFEAAWLHPESIAPLLQRLMTGAKQITAKKEVKSSPKLHGASSSTPPVHVRSSVVNKIVIGIMGILIDVTRKSFLDGDDHVPLSCTIRQEKGRPIVLGIPVKKAKGKYNFTTRAVFSGTVRYCVLYVTEDRRILGVKVPPTDQKADPSFYKGDPENLSPDASKYYITYLGWDFVVYHEEGNLLSLKDVKLYPKNKENDNFYMRVVTTFAVSAVEINCFDVKFFAARRHRQNQTSPIIYDNSLVIFEAAWLHAKYIPNVLRIYVPQEQLNIWNPVQKKPRFR